MLVSGKILDSCTFDACGLMGWSPRVMPLSLPPLARNHHAMAVADQIKFRTRIFPRGSHRDCGAIKVCMLTIMIFWMIAIHPCFLPG